MKTEKAEQLIENIKASLARGSYSHQGTTWERDGDKLTQHDDDTGSWHSVCRGSLTLHVCHIARSVADWSDDAEGEVIDAMRAKYHHEN